MKPELSVIVATMNEEGSIGACVRRILTAVPNATEVIVVDGGRDRTGALVTAMADADPRIRYFPNRDDRGKGHAIRTGVLAARGRFHAQIDADLQFRPEELDRLVQPLREGIADVVMGSRFLPQSQRTAASVPLPRRLGNRAVSAFASAASGCRWTDVLAGFKAWTRPAIERIGLKSDSYSYEIEIPMKARRHGLRVVEVPVSTEARQTGRSKVRTWIMGPLMLSDIVAFRLGWK